MRSGKAPASAKETLDSAVKVTKQSTHDPALQNRPRRHHGTRHRMGAVKPFRYALDPACVLACASYALNRGVLKPHAHSTFLHAHFNDLLLIPAALPLVLWLQRRFGLRAHDAPPDAREIALHFAVWAICAEIIAPHFAHGTGDWRDALAYAVGAIAAWAWWQRGGNFVIPSKAQAERRAERSRGISHFRSGRRCVGEV